MGGGGAYLPDTRYHHLKLLETPPSPKGATSLHSQSRLSASMQRVLCACDECSTTSIYSDPKRFNTSIYLDPTQFSKKNMGLLGLAIFCHLGFSKTMDVWFPWIFHQFTLLEKNRSFVVWKVSIDIRNVVKKTLDLFYRNNCIFTLLRTSHCQD